MTFSLDFWILQSAAMLLTVLIVPKLRLTGISGVIFMIAAIALVNNVLWDPSLFSALPDSLTSRTALLLFTNGVIFFVLVKLLPGIEIDGLLPAIAAPIVFTLSSVAIRTYGSDVDWEQFFVSVADATSALFHSLKSFFQS